MSGVLLPCPSFSLFLRSASFPQSWERAYGQPFLKGGGMDDLFPSAGVMEQLAGFVPAFVAYGLVLCVVFWIIGYVVWFIIQFIR
jgi:hypothetical protein